MRKIAIVVCALLTGCASAPQIAPNELLTTLRSEPAGAMIYSTNLGTAFGMAPVQRIYTLDEAALKGGLVQVHVTAVWPSGAQKSERINFNTRIRQGHYTISRPANAPGMAMDLAHAMRIQARDAAQKAEADAAFANAMATLVGAAAGVAAARNTPAPIAPSPSFPQSISCTTLGVHTTCNAR